MGDAEWLATIEAKLDHGIANVRSSRNYYRRGSQVQTVTAAGLSATTTLLIGLNEIYRQTTLTALALGTAGLTTVAVTWTAWFAFRKLWISNNTALAQLNDLRDRIDYDKARTGQPPEERLTQYEDWLQAIFSNLNSAWTDIRQQN